jgi:hypothetical protein
VNSTQPLIFIHTGYNTSITSNQSFDQIDADASGITFTVNSSWIDYSSTADVNLSNISYLSGVWSYNADAVSGTLTVLAQVPNIIDNYNFSVNGVTVAQMIATTGTVQFTHVMSSSYIFMISLAPYINGFFLPWRAAEDSVSDTWADWSTWLGLAVLIATVTAGLTFVSMRSDVDKYQTLVLIAVVIMVLMVVLAIVPKIGFSIQSVYEGYNP